MPRLGYQKTRTGCMRCRQRRVKCDESRPCSACARHSVHCSLTDSPADAQQPKRPNRSVLREPDQPTPKPRARPIKPREDSSPSACASPSPSDGDPFPYLTSLVTRQESQDSKTWTSDLELMHHFTAITWKTLPRGPELSDIWQLELPRLAFSHDFLAHQILAISAAHMAFLNPDQHNGYSIRASQHQNKAVQGLRSTLPDANSSNCHAIFAAASLLSISAFAALSQHTTQHGQPDIADLLHIFLLMRGMHGILKSHEDNIKLGPIGNLLRLGTYQSATTLLLEIVEELNSMKIPADVNPSVEAYCREGFTSLLDWIRYAGGSASLPELRVVMTWPTNLSDGFISLMRERHGPSLKILACYCRILESLGNDHWYLRGWGRNVLKDISKSGSV